MAVAGAKGSPGCTFLAAALGRCFAGRGLRTLVVDADAEGGGLGCQLRVETAGRAGAGDGEQAAGARVAERLWFVELAGGNGAGGIAAGSAPQHDVVVVDLGHRLEPPQRQICLHSDWILWVVVPDRSGLERADRLLAGGGVPGGSPGLVFNRLGAGSLRGAEMVMSERHRMPVMARIPFDLRGGVAVADGVAPHRRAPFRRPIHDLTSALHPDLGGRRGTWP